MKIAAAPPDPAGEVSPRAAWRARRHAVQAGLSLLLLALTPVAHARLELPLRMRVHAGFAGPGEPLMIREGWTPVAVQLTSDVARPIECELRLTLDGPQVEPYEQRLALKLPATPGTWRTYHLYAHLRPVPRGPLTLRVTLHHDGRPVAAPRVERTAVAAGGVRRLLAPPVEGTHGLPTALRSTGGLQVHRPPMWAYPDRWVGYQGLAAVVLWNTPFERLSPAQRQALGRWLMRGGRAIVSPPNVAWLQQPFLGPLLRARALTHVRHARLPSLLRSALGPHPSQTGLRSIDGQFERELERHRARGEGSALVVLRYGRGRIAYLPFDLARRPFSYGPWAVDVLEAAVVPLLLAPVSRGPGTGPWSPELPSLDAPLRLPLDVARERTPDLRIAALLILGYLILVGPINFMLLRRRRQRVALVFSIPVIALATTAALLAWGAATKGVRPTIRQIEVIQLAPAVGGTRRSVYVGLYSPSTRRYPLRCDQALELTPFGPLRSTPPPYRGDRLSPTSISVPAYSMRYLHAREWLPLPPVELRVDAAPAGTVRLVNTLGRRLRAPLVIRLGGGRAWRGLRLPDAGPGPQTLRPLGALDDAALRDLPAIWSDARSAARLAGQLLDDQRAILDRGPRTWWLVAQLADPGPAVDWIEADDRVAERGPQLVLGPLESNR